MGSSKQKLTKTKVRKGYYLVLMYVNERNKQSRSRTRKVMMEEKKETQKL